MIDDVITTLSEAIMQQQCVLFLGDNIFDSNTTNIIMLDKLKQTRKYISSEMSFLEAINIKSIMEGRSSVLEFIKEQIRRPPATHHTLYSEISKLPFSAIISTSFDNNLETSLTAAKIPCQVIIDDSDIYTTFKPVLPVIKLFGSPLQGKLRVSLDEIRDIFRDNSLVGQYVKVLCANKNLLFVGYKLEDKDFFNFFNLISRELGTLRGLTFIAAEKSGQFESDLWSRQKNNLVNSNPLDLLQKLNVHIMLSKSSPSASRNLDDKTWIDNPFFRPLFYVRSLPSVNQVVDGILAIVLQILENESDSNLEVLADRIINSIEQISQFRPNYASLQKLSRKIEVLFPPHKKTTIEELKIDIETLMSIRSQSRKILAEKGSLLLLPDDKLLLYSQSTCVNAVVKTWLDKNRGKTRKAEIILPEIRPKSPLPFQDALATVQSITSNDPTVPIILIPDASIAHMIQSGRVSKIIMGVDKIYENNDDGQEKYIVTNVTGTLNIVIIAMNKNVPVYFFAEEDKIYQRNLAFDLKTQYKPEEKIIPEPSFINSPVDDYYFNTINSKQVAFYNPGYDEIDSENCRFTIVTETREIHPKK